MPKATVHVKPYQAAHSKFVQLRAQTLRQKAPAKSTTRELDRRFIRAVASQSQSLPRQLFPTGLLDTIAVEIERAPCETMPAKQIAGVSLEEEFRPKDESSKENSKYWYWHSHFNSGLKGKESKVRILAHKLSERGIPFQSVRGGKNITREEVL